ncbi:hypothetical protein A7E78_10930 [Syntrophotalea acetylenivorans]|uniref:J domain-containing protein n=1 Tax=Syntrophotalea acetylenivorans TaxID=1842532 RepID=A0A1L3GQW8_9BACT|nr:J domain-containing protein [Syntrophotalea acetylenivorans]APG28317.1 hypothetical protein A7E78_10930 [Syntrophotalea acetylenivorans]
MEKTCYQLLAVSPEAGYDEIRRAFRRQARRCHPDTAAPDMADEDLFQEILAAYRTLSSPLKRASYDAQLSSARSAGSDSFLQKLRELCRSRRRWLNPFFRFVASASVARTTPVRNGPPPVKVRARYHSSGPTFGQVLAARQQAEYSSYVLCEDGIIRPKNRLGAARRKRPLPPHRPKSAVVLRSWWGVLLLLLVGVWEMFRR